MNLLPLEEINVVGLAGVGSVGQGWASLLLASGYQVIAADPAQGAEKALLAGIRDRWPSLIRLGLTTASTPPWERLSFSNSVSAMARASDLVQENAPEAPDIKSAVLKEVDEALHPSRLILSSSGGVTPTQLQAQCAFPERVVLGHPFHPAHIVPLVEVVGGQMTSPAAVNLALAFYRKLGKQPILLKQEVVGHLANRLQFALLREASHCLASGVASAEDIDAALKWGLGPRWALMGSLMTFNLAGGEGGVSSLLDRFADDIQRWWDSLVQTRLTAQTREALISGAKELEKGISIKEWECWRDEALIDFFVFRDAHPDPVASMPLPSQVGAAPGPQNRIVPNE